MPVAFEMVGKPQTPSVALDKQGLNCEQRLASGQAADDGGCHGESDRILRSGFFAQNSWLHSSQRPWETD